MQLRVWRHVGGFGTDKVEVTKVHNVHSQHGMTCIFCLTFSVGTRTKHAATSPIDDAPMYANASTYQKA